MDTKTISPAEFQFALAGFIGTFKYHIHQLFELCMNLTDEEKKKYIQEIFKHCGTDSILIINHIGHLERLYCPFYVRVIVDPYT